MAFDLEREFTIFRNRGDRLRFRHRWQMSILVCLLLALPVSAQQPAQRSDNTRSPARPPYQVAERLTPKTMKRPIFTAQQPGEHPLMPAIRWARQGMKTLDNIQDFSATMVKREQVNGKLSEHEYLFVKIRHKPLSVYMYFLDPASVKGQEVIWVKGKNNGKMQAHGTGLKKVFGTVSLDPTGPVAMKGNRYPITEVGMVNLVKRLIEVGEHDAKYGECEVNYYNDAKINNRTCTCIQVVHPKRRKTFLFHIARIFIDDELNIPIRYESYDWPKEPGKKPPLIEEYTYLNILLNNGFTDADFDVNNPNYSFTSRRK